MSLLPFAIAAAISMKPLPPTAQVVPNMVTVWTSPALAPLARRIAARVEAAHRYRVTVRAAGSDVAFAGLYTGLADVALIGRDATDSEKQAFEWIWQRPPADQPLIRGSAGTPAQSPALAILVNRRNSIASLDLEQLRRMFTAATPQHWRDYGVHGPLGAMPIHLHMADASSGTGRFFRETALEGRSQMIWDRIIEHGASDASGEAVARAVAADPAALGIGETDTAADVRVIPLVVAGTAVMPSPADVRTSRYPLSRTLHAYFDRPAIRPEVQAFLDEADRVAKEAAEGR
jgi:phosphate transport system substrate-binding protein